MKLQNAIQESVVRFAGVGLAAFIGYKFRLVLFEGGSWLEPVPFKVEEVLFILLIAITTYTFILYRR